MKCICSSQEQQVHHHRVRVYIDAFEDKNRASTLFSPSSVCAAIFRPLTAARVATSTIIAAAASRNFNAGCGVRDGPAKCSAPR